jgi:hypothetical protein
MRRGLKSGRRQVASDTTVERVCRAMKSADVGQRLSESWRAVRGRGLLGRRIQGRKRRVGLLDGTFLGGQWQSVLFELGEIATPVAAMRYAKRGKELVASHGLLKRFLAREGRGVFDLLLLDGLYANERMWARCEAMGAAAVVKTTDTTLTIVQDANGLFDAPRRLPGVEFARGVDATRNSRYRVWAVGDLPWSNKKRRLKVARVEETSLKGPRQGQTVRFWVISQDQTLGAETLRTLAHARWFIENNGFKAFNEQCHSKHVFSRHPATAFTLSRLQMIGRTWLELYRHTLQSLRQTMTHLWDHGTFPLRLLRTFLWSSLDAAGADTT